jgi:septal ring factor EnvC (AmiA/AmiB activator)
MKSGLWSGVAGVLLLCALSVPAAQPNKKHAEADLKAVTERIERVQRQVQHDEVEKDRLNRDLKAAEQSVAQAQGRLSKLREQRSARGAERNRLLAARAEREQERQRSQEDLAAQLRAAYFIGRNEPLKLLLNQRTPSEVQRNFTYYGYFGRQRANQIGLIDANLAEIESLRIKIEAEDARLAQVEGEQKKRVAELEAARRQRGHVLASLEQESLNRSTMLKRLQQQQEQLDRLLKELSRATESIPFDPNDPFAKLRGKLSWPVAGRMQVDFGDAIAGGLRSNGIEIAADRGTSVRAIHEGRVDYADWLPGHGLIIILNHGNGYLSLYSHNEELFKQVGATVQAGEVISSVGDSGGRQKSALYFEIRRGGKPIDPKGWFRSANPPVGSAN